VVEEHGLAGVAAQERYRLLLILQNIEAIEVWRAGLDEGQRRRWNHPNAVWARWRRSKTDVEAVRHDVVKPAMPSHPNDKPIHWPQDAVRIAHLAMLDSRSHDLLVLARLALEAAIRSENDLVELLDDAKPRPASAVATAHAAA
jgi:hypothetical protein